MLTALEEGVEGGKWFRLFDKIFSERNLLAAFQKVAQKKGAAGVDHVTTRDFERQLPGAIQALSATLKGGTFTPQAIRGFTSQNQARRRHDHWGFPRFGIESCRRRW
jgi:RNA-directed DNA polymerase